MRFLYPAIVGALLLSTGCSDNGPIPADLAIRGVQVIPMTGETVLANQTVLIGGDRIVGVGSATEVRIPRGVREVDGDGTYLLPGLTDMHVHTFFNETWLEEFVQSGVTTVRDLYGVARTRVVMEEIRAGERWAPTIYSTSPQIDGPEGFGPEKEFIEGPAEAEEIVSRLVAAGWQSLKLYQSLQPEPFDAVVAAAKRHGIPYGGHVPTDVGLIHCLNSGYRFIEHLTGYDVELGGKRNYPGFLEIDEARIPGLVEATRASGVWNCPTLMVNVAASANHRFPEAQRQIVFANVQRLVKALYDAGCPLLAGSDASGRAGSLIPFGTSLLDELDEFEACGLTPFEVLRIATTEAARFLGESHEFGTVEVGKRADLILVRGNPLEDLGALRDLHGVVLRGTWRQYGTVDPDRGGSLATGLGGGEDERRPEHGHSLLDGGEAPGADLSQHAGCQPS